MEIRRNKSRNAHKRLKQYFSKREITNNQNTNLFQTQPNSIMRNTRTSNLKLRTRNKKNLNLMTSIKTTLQTISRGKSKNENSLSRQVRTARSHCRIVTSSKMANPSQPKKRQQSSSRINIHNKISGMKTKNAWVHRKKKKEKKQDLDESWKRQAFATTAKNLELMKQYSKLQRQSKTQRGSRNKDTRKLILKAQDYMEKCAVLLEKKKKSLISPLPDIPNPKPLPSKPAPTFFYPDDTKKFQSIGQKFREKHSQFIEECINSPRLFRDLENEIGEIIRRKNKKFASYNTQSKILSPYSSRAENAKCRRLKEEEQLRAKRSEYITIGNKWKIKKKKEREERHFSLLQQRKKLFIIHTYLAGYLKEISDKFEENKQEKIVQWCGKMLGKKLIYKYQTFICNRSRLFEERMQTRIQMCFKSVWSLGMGVTVEERARKIFLMFLSKRQVKTRLKRLFINYGEKLHSVFRKLEANVLRKRQKKQELVDMWEEQKLEIINILRKSKKTVKNSRIKRNLIKLPNEVRDTVLRLYLEKCENQHSIAFFKWMENHSFKTADLIQSYISRLKKSTTEIDNYYLKDEEVGEDNEIKELEQEIGITKEPNKDLEVPDEEDPSQDKRENIDFFMLDTKEEEDDDCINEFDMIGIEISQKKNRRKKGSIIKAFKAPIDLPSQTSRNITDKIKGLSIKINSDIKDPSLKKQESLYKTSNYQTKEKHGGLENPPKLKYKPSKAVMREQILRSLYFKDSSKN
ncbi:unnamed protein product [Moneuplotes crassus]|uniref:Uncharacterized protein n=1 Tax=Euplotes crassus TaxID=5936 RepID=A0AAD1XYA8_EUPCR|nr:unnamed protein product [Moneuplotes crassus]